MADAKFYDLGSDPSKANDIGKPDKMHYPCVYDIGPDEFPPMKDMKLGDTGEATIQFKIAKGGGIQILQIKMNSMAADKTAVKGKDKSEPMDNGDSEGGY